MINRVIPDRGRGVGRKRKVKEDVGKEVCTAR